MKNIIIYLSLFVATNLSANSYTCKEHTNTLKLKEIGVEHVNHLVYLNSQILIKELKDGLWFIEGITCMKNGFKIIASHIQYGDSTQKTFILNLKQNKDYELIQPSTEPQTHPKPLQ